VTFHGAVEDLHLHGRTPRATGHLPGELDDEPSAAEAAGATEAELRPACSLRCRTIAERALIRDAG
jgi:hypothetical protein